ncbi:hypothetical protein [Paenibacillus sp. R14(2021)]|uniref:hypothetical protein n=1 Tax=Paenibacillus sp. R14(2021) TaxID=2859228 RepID=UPI001C611700|nr:hypothetical protein [Paenibacillus sp. R14(2021)]
MGQQGTRKAIRAVITGSTGMVGEGLLHECLRHPDVEQVLVINRKSCGVTPPKLRELGVAMIHSVAAECK